MRHTSIEAGSGVPPLPDEVRAELEVVLASSAFRRSERHSQFLRFVCETFLNGDGAKLNEYFIAHEVFGRGADYSPGEDSVVRRQAHSLRQKLQDYYSGEGKDDPIRIDLPLGRYIPVFVRAQQASNVDPTTPAASPTPEPLHSSRRRWWLWAVIGGAITIFALGWALGHETRRERTATSIDPLVNEIWGPWISDPGGAVICFSNPLSTVVKQFPSPLPPNSQPARIAVTPEQDLQFRQALDLAPGGYLYLSPAISQSKTGEALGSIMLTKLLTNAGVAVSASQSRFLNWDDFRTRNLILLGHDEANRWIDPLLSKLPLRLGQTTGDKPRRIVNTMPDKGQRSEYYIRYPIAKDQPSDDYALVSMVTGIDGRHQLLLINGVNTEGTQMAMEYLCDPVALKALVSSLRKTAPNHKGIWHFQIVLRAEVRDKVPTRAELLLVKVL